MSVRLRVSHRVDAPLDTVWKVLVDWEGQARWIPLTQVEVTTAYDTGLGVRARALSGFWLGRLPVGLLDNFVVTGWTSPVNGRAELEVLHLGPYFTGEGVFALQADGSGTVVTATEVINLPLGRWLDPVVRWLLPLMRVGFGVSLRSLARLAERPA